MNRGAEHHVDVLVVGAGPTGLVMACELARHGVRCRIVDKAAVRSDKSKALGVQARTLEVFESLGIVEKAIAAGHLAEGINIYAGGKKACLSLEGLESPYPFVLILEQSETEQILEDRLRALGGTVERQVDVPSFKQDGEGITTTLLHAGGREETVRSGWLVGCDGAHSSIRHTLGVPFEGAPYPEELWLADVRMESSLPRDQLHAFWGKGVVALVPMRGGYHRIIAWSRETNAGHGDPTLQEIQAIVHSVGPPWVVLSDPIWLASFRIHRRMVQEMRQGRVFLAGDAAHIHSPIGGQGMNTGIQEAYNLAWKLALVRGGHAGPALLDSYQEERHPVAASVLRGTNFLTRLVLMHNPILRAARNLALPFIMSRTSVQQQARDMISEIGINYRRSPIVGESWFPADMERDFSAGPTAGDRAPDAPAVGLSFPATTRLFQLLRGTEHVLLLFGGAHSTAQGYRQLAETGHKVQQRYSGLITVHLVAGDTMPGIGLDWYGSVVLDKGLILHRRYGAVSPCLYLIRPDGYVAYRNRPVQLEAVENYLRRIFARRS